MPQCKECRWHFNLEAVNDRTEWRNCLALPYPQCLSFTHVNTECPVPELFKGKDDVEVPVANRSD